MYVVLRNINSRTEGYINAVHHHKNILSNAVNEITSFSLVSVDGKAKSAFLSLQYVFVVSIESVPIYPLFSAPEISLPVLAFSEQLQHKNKP